MLLDEFGVYQVELEAQNEELRKAQQELERARDRYHSLYEYAPVGYFTLNRQGEVLEVNLTGCELLGEPRSRIVGRTLAAVLAEEEVRDFYLHVRSLIDNNAPAAIDLRLAAAEGRVIEVTRLTSTPVQEGDVRLCRTAVSDVTAIKKAEKILSTTNRKLERRVAERTADLEKANASLRHEVAERRRAELEAQQATAAKSRFLANMSHEIRTPMTVTLGTLELLLQSQLDAQQREQVDMAKSASSLLLRLIDDILDLSQVEAGKLGVVNRSFLLRTCLENVMALNRSLAEQKNLSLELEVSPLLPENVFGDETRVKQILLNLVGNAVKFTESGKVTVTAAPLEETDQVRFAVRDTGIGIPPAQREKLFRPFSQGDSSTKRLYGGTGLGLALSRQLAEIMGGGIEVESCAGRGATFTFTLTLPPAGEEATRDAPRQSAAAGQKDPVEKGCILVVEDVEMVQWLLRQLLEDKGWEILCAGTGREAIALWESRDVDLILMDVQMPGLDGFETTRIIRERKEGAHIPIIGLTAHAREEDRLACLAAGMNDRLTKPLDLPRLYATIENHLRTCNSHRPDQGQ